MDRVLQPPLVDTTACLCRVDTGLRTVAGAKKYVPGTKLCLRPDIKPSIHPTRNKPARGDRSRNQSPLLPGLPDDLAIACLIRVPRVEHRKLRLVCKRWYRLLVGNFFYSLRKSLRLAEEWIYVIKRDRDGKISWHAFDPVYQQWQPLPPVPKEYSGALGFGCAVLNGCHLYLFGGKDPLKGSMRRVIFYSTRTNKWHRAPDMLRRRHFFGSCVINNCLFVAGGENEGVHRSLRSAEVYDPNKNRWSFISDMSTAMVPFIGVVYDRKWFLKGLGSHRQVLSEVYQPENDSWCPVQNGMVSGWRNPSTTLNGKLYALDCKDGCKLRVYDNATDSWSKHIDSRMHLGFLVGFSSIFWRESWKYGERGFRYCNHDVGHAIGAVSMAAASLGWDVKLLDSLGFEELKFLMGVHVFPEFETPSRAVKGKIPEIEFEHPDCVMLVFPSGVSGFDLDYKELSNAMLEFSKLEWKGKPNSLSKEHVCWDIIYKTSEVVKKSLTLGDRFLVDPFQRSGICSETESESVYKGLTVREVVRKRRSAVDMDGVTGMERETFYQILSHCLPSGSQAGKKQGKQLSLPFRAFPWDAEVHAALFVHRVVGLPQGLYFLVRNEDHFAELKKAMNPDFVWTKPEGCPDELPLYELFRSDCRRLAKQLSCHQDIASDGCFSLGMLARMEPSLRENNVSMYPRLFWETGVLGQVLYLEAHAVGISATGIGCFFDDPVHQLLGLKGSTFQSLYHFTVGSPVEDKRIMSLPAYPGPEDVA